MTLCLEAGSQPAVLTYLLAVTDFPQGRWRFRVGDYRIRFDIAGRLLLFYRVRHRQKIYE